MAISIKGIQPLSFGSTVSAGYITESTTEDESTEEVLIEDEIGDIVTSITGIGIKFDVSIDVIPKAGTTPPSAGQTFTYSGITMVILNISRKKIKKDVQKWTIKGNRFPLINL